MGRCVCVGGLVQLFLILLVTDINVKLRASYSRSDSYSVTKHTVVGYALCAGSIGSRVMGSALSSLAMATLKASSVVVGGRGGMRALALPLQCASSSAVFVFCCTCGRSQALYSAVCVGRRGIPCFRSVRYKCDVGRDVIKLGCDHLRLSAVRVPGGRTGASKARGLGLLCHGHS